MKRPRKVHDNLYQCDEKLARTLLTTDAYKQYGIRGVICPAFNVRVPYHRDLAALILSVDDYDDVPGEYFYMVTTFQAVFSPVVVHCRGGKNRSAVFAAACGFALGISPEETYRKIGHRPTSELHGSLVRWLENQPGGSLVNWSAQ